MCNIAVSDISSDDWTNEIQIRQYLPIDEVDCIFGGN